MNRLRFFYARARRTETYRRCPVRQRLYPLLRGAAGICTLFLVSTAAGCDYQPLSEKPAEFTLPEWPPDSSDGWPELACWLITYTECNGSTVRGTVAAERRFFKLTLPLSGPSAVQAYPVTYTQRGSTDCTLFFHPAGCIWPVSAALTWPDGFAAGVLRLFAEQASSLKTAAAPEDICAHFNWQRLCSTVHNAQQKNAATSPWLLDETKIITGIAAASFRASMLAQPAEVSVRSADILSQSGLTDEEAAAGTADSAGGALFLLADYVPANVVPAADSEDSTAGCCSSGAGLSRTYAVRKGTGSGRFMLCRRGTAADSGISADALITVKSCTAAGKMSLVRTGVPLYTDFK